MKKSTLAVLLVLLNVSILFGQDWITHKNLEFDFRADFPAEPKLTTQNVPTQVGEIEISMFILDLTADLSSKNILYLVSYNQYPEEEFNNMGEGSENLVLDNAVKFNNIVIYKRAIYTS